MKKIVLTTSALWVLLLSPALCLSGVLLHPCPDCPQGFSCEHEEGCSADPCADLLPQSGSTSTPNALDIAPAILPFLPIANPAFSTSGGLLGAPLLPDCENLPHPESDLPLRI